MTQHTEPVLAAQLAFSQAASDYEDLPDVPNLRMLNRRARELRDAFAVERKTLAVVLAESEDR